MKLTLAVLLAGTLGATAPSLEEMEFAPKFEKRGSQRLHRGRLVILEEGKSERWLVERQGAGEPKKIKRLKRGRPWRILVGRSAKEDAAWVPRVSRAYGTLKLESTGYDPGPESNGKGNEAMTVTGVRARFGIAAVDPKVIPLKTLLYIEGYGTAQAMDIGGAIKEKRIDLCFNSTREADDWGRKKGTRVWLLGGVKKSEADAVLRALSLTAN